MLKPVSTSKPLNHLTEFIRKRLNSKKHISCIFVHLRKAFRTVNHVVFLDKLKHNGVRGIALELLRSYLSDRKQHVFLGGVNTTLKNITISVPQGSNLGSLLFLVYINDLPSLANLPFRL